MIQCRERNNIKFKTNKIELMFLTRKRKSNDKEKVVKIQGREFQPNVKAIRILKEWIDSRLIFKEHWTTMKLKESRVFNILKDLTKT